MNKRIEARRRLDTTASPLAFATTDKGRLIPRVAGLDQEPLSALVQTAMTRRALLAGGVAAAAALSLPPARALAEGTAPSSATFPELARVMDDHDHWAEGYERAVLLRWGDPILPNAPAFDALRQTASAAAGQFGVNCDMLVFLPLPYGSQNSEHGLLFVNHEYPNPQLMWPGLTEGDAAAKMSPEQIAVTMQSVGNSVVEIRKGASGWDVVPDSSYARRITATTPIRISGPAAGHPMLRTKADPEGRTVLGTFDNCNGGVTPWGTVLSCEEGFDGWFGGDPRKTPDAKLLARYGASEPENSYGWDRVDPRFNYEAEPNEPNRFDWVVEIDPFDPAAQPVKRTALGRFTHETATIAQAPDGRIVVYLADDHEFDYLYRFVTAGRFDPANREANRDLLDDGTLSVARFKDDMTLEWVPLVHGTGKLTAENGFASQADVAVKTRLAADLVGATPMDAPEGFSVNPKTGKIYVALTENTDITLAQVNAPNPRAPNPEGHLIELIPPGAAVDAAHKADHAAETYRWDIFILCGDPKNPEAKALYHPGTSGNGWFTDPDNIGFDPSGRMYVCTDGPPDAGFNDALYVLDTEGEGRALPKLFYSPPVGSECSSPAFTPDGKTLFLSVQHPGENSESLDKVSTRWPDFKPDTPPRPSVIVITKADGGPVGT
ncbi:PhoX family protein [Segnochrobactrum spirostomi]|nr:PhoX family phosphatase [Segnochrobactrum spirostomi]